MGEQNFQRELERIDNFQELMSREGSELFQEELDGEWFCRVKRSLQTYYEKDEREPYDFLCFPYIWLCVEGDWDLANPGMKKLEAFAHFRGKENLQNLQKIVRRLKQKDGEGAALEISSLIKFLNDEKLYDIEPKYDPHCRSRADALIEIDRRDIIVEASAITKQIVRLGPMENRTSIPLDVKQQ